MHRSTGPTQCVAPRIRWLAALLLGVVLLPASAQTLVIAGTGADLAAMRHLATRYAEKYDLPVRVLPSIGSGGAVKALVKGDIQLGLASRALTPAERAQGVEEHLYARTPLAFVVHPGVPVSSITRPQVHDILQGSLNQWHPQLPIRPILRPRSDSDSITLVTQMPELRQALFRALNGQAVVAYTDQESAEMLERVAGSIGTCSLVQLLSEQRELKPLALDGIQPTAENLRDGLYPLYKSLYFLTREPVSPSVRGFMEFVAGEGREYMQRTGHWLPDSPR